MATTIGKANIAIYQHVLKEDKERLLAKKIDSFFIPVAPGERIEHVVSAKYFEVLEDGAFSKQKPEFFRMIEDAMNGKIDMIFTSTICAFSGNLVEALYYCSLLKEKGIDVFFLDMGLSTVDEDEFDASIEMLPCLKCNQSMRSCLGCS